MTIGYEKWNEHAALVGRVTLAWNGATMQVLRIFCHLTGIGSPLAETIFFSHKSDRAQRGMILAIAKQVDLGEKDCRALSSLMKALDKVAVGRNLAAHTIFSLSLFDPETGAWGARVVPALTPAQDVRLEPDFEQQFQAVERTLSDIAGRLEHWLIHTPYPTRQWEGRPFVGPLPGES